MFTDFSGRVELYTPAPGVVQSAIPVIQPSNNRSNVKTYITARRITFCGF